ncbi:hypothetical protein [Flaviflexus massiliensis]|uniref:hypothetical protein n=1 Tax=Flaviflexus massiliensis TaxID=1522309 RepID=UPI0011C82B1B|nr:hypothetical protein [Flaviflexus massiliensis]
MTAPSIQRWRPPPWFLLRVPEVHPDALSRPSLYRQIEDVVSRYPLTILKTPIGFRQDNHALPVGPGTEGSDGLVYPAGGSRAAE